jgi:hypothetical protein
MDYPICVYFFSETEGNPMAFELGKFFSSGNVCHDKPAVAKARSMREYMGRKSPLGQLVRKKTTDKETKESAKSLMREAYSGKTTMGSKPAASRIAVKVLKNDQRAKRK